MIDHISLAVSDLDRSVPFYDQLFAALGMSRVVTRPAMVGFGKAYPEVWINLRGGMQRLSPDNGVHLCLRAKSIGEVDAFHAAALAAGGTSESVPSLRPHDRVRYYATFVVDPDGNRIEAVTFPQEESAAP
jgi:catechol 2,3-dioxygenase-like lactoylglutathione lyase family enzyme